MARLVFPCFLARGDGLRKLVRLATHHPAGTCAPAIGAQGIPEFSGTLPNQPGE